PLIWTMAPGTGACVVASSTRPVMTRGAGGGAGGGAGAGTGGGGSCAYAIPAAVGMASAMASRTLFIHMNHRLEMQPAWSRPDTRHREHLLRDSVRRWNTVGRTLERPPTIRKRHE